MQTHKIDPQGQSENICSNRDIAVIEEIKKINEQIDQLQKVISSIQQGIEDNIKKTKDLKLKLIKRVPKNLTEKKKDYSSIIECLKERAVQNEYTKRVDSITPLIETTNIMECTNDNVQMTNVDNLLLIDPIESDQDDSFITYDDVLNVDSFHTKN